MNTKCDWPYCSARATVNVYDFRNENKGQFCKKHGKERVSELNESQGQFGGKVR
jgi:hypothetical protein